MASFFKALPALSEQTSMPYTRRSRCLRFVLVVLVFSKLWTNTVYALTFTSFTGVGDLPGGLVESDALGISPDGQYIFGNSNASASTEAFSLYQGKLTGLGHLPGGSAYSSASAASYDGSVIVGSAQSATGVEAFFYKNGVMSGLGGLPGSITESYGSAISSDGAVIVGSVNGINGGEAFIFRDGVMRGLGSLTFAAFDISADGSVVVGYNRDLPDWEAFIYENDQITLIGDLPGGPNRSVANAVADNGSVVGYGSSSQGIEAFIYENGVMTSIGDFPGSTTNSQAVDISADGELVIGYGTPEEGGFNAFVWEKSSNTMHSIHEALVADGINLEARGWTQLSSANGISSDGTKIVGSGYHNGRPEGWVATLDRSSQSKGVRFALLNIPSEFANKSPGSDHLWGTDDDIHDLGAVTGVLENLNDFGGAGYAEFKPIAFSGSGHRVFTENSTFGLEDVNTIEKSVLTEEILGNTLPSDLVFTQGEEQNASVTFFSDHTRTSNGSYTNNYGITFNFNGSGYWINREDNPSTIFHDNPNIAAHFNRLKSALDKAQINYSAIDYERGTQNAINGANSGVVTNFSKVFISSTKIGAVMGSAVSREIPVPFWTLGCLSFLLIAFCVKRFTSPNEG